MVEKIVMDPLDAVPVFKFSTVDYPERDRFHVWVKDNLCECKFEDDGYGAFNAEASGAALGPLIISGRRWPERQRMPKQLQRPQMRVSKRVA